MKETPTGTREWAVKNINICRGCEHNCKYCYARANALRFKQIESAADWPRIELLSYSMKMEYPKYDGTVMFPSTHDIMPRILGESVWVLKKLIESGNKVLIVSKPHWECIDVLAKELQGYQNKILFRFTIGSLSDVISKFWEPGAPDPVERIDALELAYRRGFKTSVSCEPLLDTEALELFKIVKPFVTDSVWFGGMNRIRQRVDMTGWGKLEKAFLKIVMLAQDPYAVKEYYRQLNGEPLIRWKDSFKRILGLEIPGKIGMDV